MISQVVQRTVVVLVAVTMALAQLVFVPSAQAVETADYLHNPMGRKLYAARQTLYRPDNARALDPYANAAVLYIQLGDVDPECVPDEKTELSAGRPTSFPEIAQQDPKLFSALELPNEPGIVLELTTLNTGHRGPHSEAVARSRMSHIGQAIRVCMKKRGRDFRYDFKESVVAVASERDVCKKCRNPKRDSGVIAGTRALREGRLFGLVPYPTGDPSLDARFGPDEITEDEAREFAATWIGAGMMVAAEHHEREAVAAAADAKAEERRAAAEETAAPEKEKESAAAKAKANEAAEAAEEAEDQREVVAAQTKADQAKQRRAVGASSSKHDVLTVKVPDAEAKGAGGIDFTTVGLRYLAVYPRNSGVSVSFAYTAKRGSGGSQHAVALSGKYTKQASDAFFVWLAADPNDFWVNLNPSEPNRIVDPTLARTGVGRVLLDADLAMKKASAQLMNPRTRLGRDFWSAAERRNAASCAVTRNWITPARATVYSSANELVIVKAPLKVNSENVVVTGCDARRFTKLYRARILPRLEKKINHAPEFAALRRVYLSRIAAGWCRRNCRPGSPYYDLIGSGHTNRWRTKSDWKPKDTWRRYVRSYKNGEWRYTTRVNRGSYIEVSTRSVGGVDFTSIPTRRVSVGSVRRAEPRLVRALPRSIDRPASAGRSTVVFSDRLLGTDPATTRTWRAPAPQPPAPVPTPSPAPTASPTPAPPRRGDSLSRDPGLYVVIGVVVLLVGRRIFAARSRARARRTTA